MNYLNNNFSKEILIEYVEKLQEFNDYLIVDVNIINYFTLPNKSIQYVTRIIMSTKNLQNKTFDGYIQIDSNKLKMFNRIKKVEKIIF